MKRTSHAAASIGACFGLLGIFNACTASTGMGAENDERVEEARGESVDRRLDHVDTISPSAGYWGAWKQDIFCNPGMWVIGYSLRVEPHLGPGEDDTSLNSVQLWCQTKDGLSGEGIISYEGLWGPWGAPVSCSGASNFLNSTRLLLEPPQGQGEDDTAANDVEFGCTLGGSIRAANGGPFGKWSDWAYCSPGTAICGVSIRFEDYVGTSEDDTAMNGMKIHCCHL